MQPLRNLTPDERDMLARLVIGEAGGSGADGQRAVASVIGNRMARSGKSLQDIIAAPSQFEAFGNRQKWGKLQGISPNDPQYKAVNEALSPLLSGQMGDPTKGATHFFSPGLQAQRGLPEPAWARGRPGVDIGGNRFLSLDEKPRSQTLAYNPASPPPVSQPVFDPSQGVPVQRSANPLQNVAPLANGSNSQFAKVGPFSVPKQKLETQAAPAPQDPDVFGLDGVRYAGRKDFEYGRSASAKAEPFKGIVFHYTGGTDLESDVAYGQRSDPARGGAFGYHFYIGPDGQIIQGAPLSKRTNHIMPTSSGKRTAGHGLENHNAIGVAFVGQSEKPTKEQVEAARRLGSSLKEKYGIDPQNIYGHGELQGNKARDEGTTFARLLREGVEPATALAYAQQQSGRQVTRQAPRAPQDPGLYAEAPPQAMGINPNAQPAPAPQMAGPGAPVGASPLVGPDGQQVYKVGQLRDPAGGGMIDNYATQAQPTGIMQGLMRDAQLNDIYNKLFGG